MKPLQTIQTIVLVALIGWLTPSHTAEQLTDIGHGYGVNASGHIHPLNQSSTLASTLENVAEDVVSEVSEIAQAAASEFHEIAQAVSEDINPLITITCIDGISEIHQDILLHFDFFRDFLDTWESLHLQPTKDLNETSAFKRLEKSNALTPEATIPKTDFSSEPNGFISIDKNGQFCLQCSRTIFRLLCNFTQDGAHPNPDVMARLNALSIADLASLVSTAKNLLLNEEDFTRLGRIILPRINQLILSDDTLTPNPDLQKLVADIDETNLRLCSVFKTENPTVFMIINDENPTEIVTVSLDTLKKFGDFHRYRVAHSSTSLLGRIQSLIRFCPFPILKTLFDFVERNNARALRALTVRDALSVLEQAMEFELDTASLARLKEYVALSLVDYCFFNNGGRSWDEPVVNNLASFISTKFSKIAVSYFKRSLETRTSIQMLITLFFYNLINTDSELKTNGTFENDNSHYLFNFFTLNELITNLPIFNDFKNPTAANTKEKLYDLIQKRMFIDKQLVDNYRNGTIKALSLVSTSVINGVFHFSSKQQLCQYKSHKNPSLNATLSREKTLYKAEPPLFPSNTVSGRPKLAEYQKKTMFISHPFYRNFVTRFTYTGELWQNEDGTQPILNYYKDIVSIPHSTQVDLTLQQWSHDNAEYYDMGENFYYKTPVTFKIWLSYRTLTPEENNSITPEQRAFLCMFGSDNPQPVVPSALRAVFETLPESIKREYTTAWESTTD